MSLEIIPVGGYSEIGRNCTIVKVDDEAVMLDLGLHMDNYVTYTGTGEDEIKPDMSPEALVRADAVPDIYGIKHLWPSIKGIVIGHAHLDHVGAVPFLASKFTAPIHGTPYTIEVLKSMLENDGKRLKNQLKSHKLGSKFKVSPKITVELINMTHSIPHTASIAVHTPHGIVVYAVDFKLDSAPVLGDKPDFKRLEQLKRKGVKALIMDTLYAHSHTKTQSESIAREMLKDVMLGITTKNKAMVVTTFSSHIARLSTIVALGKKMRRKIYFVGRSFSKYLDAAKKCGIADFSKQAEFVRYGSQVPKFFKKIKDTRNCLFIVTGHQAEPGSVLPRMVYNDLMKFNEGDIVIFSCGVIPVENNKINRDNLEAELMRRRVRIFSDVHVSGHAAREDHRDMINLVRPQYIIPTHAERQNLEATRDLAVELGYKPEQVKILRNFETARLA